MFRYQLVIILNFLEEFPSGYLMKILDENEYENENWLGNLQENRNELLENGQARSGS